MKMQRLLCTVVLLLSILCFGFVLGLACSNVATLFDYIPTFVHTEPMDNVKEEAFADTYGVLWIKAVILYIRSHPTSWASSSTDEFYLWCNRTFIH
jgi:hypothetical protein